MLRSQGEKIVETIGQTQASVVERKNIVKKSMNTLPTANIDDTIAMLAK